jgi:NADH-quinone oxidoreductase subunit J
MAFTDFLFILFALILTASALMVVTARHPVTSALFLILAFFNAAALWLLLQAELLAILLVLVYIGAVMVLFLFIVMMVDIDLDTRRRFTRFVPASMIVGGIIITEAALILWRSYRTMYLSTDTVAAHANSTYSNTREIGKLIYTQYIFAFEIVGLVLLVAIIAALALTLRRTKDRKYTDPARQVRVHREDRIHLSSL